MVDVIGAQETRVVDGGGAGRGVDLVDRQREVMGENALEEEGRKVVDDLEARGVVEVVEIDGNRVLVFESFDFLREGFGDAGQQTNIKDYLRNLAPQVSTNEKLGNRQVGATCYWLFRDVKVLTRGDYEHEEEPRDLFYVPENAGSALDEDEIRWLADGYYLTLADVGTRPIWSRMTYPTKENGYEDKLSVFEVVTMEAVFGRGEGEFDVDGELWVKDGEDRVPISGRWMRRNMLTSGVDAKLWDRVTKTFKERLGNLEDVGVLTRDMFPEGHMESTGIVGRNGFASVEGVRVYVGKREGYVGNRLAVSRDGKRVEVRSKTGGRVIKSIELGKLAPAVDRLRSPRDRIKVRYSTAQVDDENVMLGTVISDGGEERRVVRVEFLADAIRELEEELGESKPKYYDVLTMAQKALLVDLTRRFGVDEVMRFANLFDGDGVYVLFDSFKYGGVGEELLGLTEYGGQAWLGEMYGDYMVMLEASDVLGGFLDQIEGWELSERGAYDLLNFRLKEAIMTRARDLFLAVVKTEEEIDDIRHQMRLIGRTAELLGGLMMGVLDVESVEDIPNVKSDGAWSSVTRVVRLKTGEKLKLTVRPVEVVGGSAAAQAGMRVTYENNEGHQMSLRLDLDPNGRGEGVYGACLDVGTRGDKVVEIFNSMGLSHHTANFDDEFADPVIFAKYMRTLAAEIMGDEVAERFEVL